MEWMLLLSPAILRSEDEPAAFDIRSLCEAARRASSDYNGQIDFSPRRFYQQRRNADLVAEATQSMSLACPYRDESCLFKQLAIMKI